MRKRMSKVLRLHLSSFFFVHLGHGRCPSPTINGFPRETCRWPYMRSYQKYEQIIRYFDILKTKRNISIISDQTTSPWILMAVCGYCFICLGTGQVVTCLLRQAHMRTEQGWHSLLARGASWTEKKMVFFLAGACVR